MLLLHLAHDVLQIDSGCAADESQAHKLCRQLQQALELDSAGDAKDNGFRALDGGPVLMDEMNKISLNPKDTLKTQGKNLIQGVFRETDEEDFSLMSDKDAAKLKKQQEKARRSQRAAYEAHQKEVQASMASKPVEVIRNAGGPNVKDIHLMNVSVSNGGAELISDASIVLVYGRKYGLVGRNGTGKTTFLRSFANKQFDGIPSNCQVLHVEQEIMGDDTTVLESVLSCDTERTRLMSEEAETSDPERLEQIAKRLHEIDAFGAEARAASILAGLSFDTNMQRRKTSSLSGGWRMRVALARALFVQPDVLLLDEPTNHLDLFAMLWLQEYLMKWPKTVVIVSHAREFLNAVCTDIVHLHSRQLTSYRGNYNVFVKTMHERMRNAKAAAEAVAAKRAHMQAFVDRFRYNANRAALVQSRIKAIQRLEEQTSGMLTPEELEAYQFKFPTPDDSATISPPIISFDDVSFRYNEDGPELYSSVSFGIDLSSRLAIVGGNGAGKSTLLGLISGALTPTKGHVYRNPKVRLAVFSQHHVDGLDLALTPLQYMASCFPDAKEPEHRSHLASFGIGVDLANQPGYTLSGGQKSRVALARITWTKPHILLLDEPSNHLDIDAVDALIKGLIEFNGGIVMVSHDQHLIEEVVCSEADNGSGQLWVVDSSSGTNTLRTATSFKEYCKSISASIMR